MTDERKMELFYYEENRYKEDDNSQTFVGAIEFNTSNLKDAAIIMRIKEGYDVPHIHILNEHFNCAVKLRKPEYYIHDEAQDKLTDEQIKIFDQFMRGYWVKHMPNYSHWEFAISMFNCIAGRHQIRIKEQPDYTLLS